MLRWLSTGTIRATPSSVAFCTMKSMRSPRGTHCTSVMANGDSRSTLRLSPTAADTRAPRTDSIAPVNSRPSPLNKISSSPLRARNTFARCAAVSADSSTTLPAVSSPSTYTRVRRTVRARNLPDDTG